MNEVKTCILLIFLVILAFTEEGSSFPTLEITVYTDKTSYSIEENIYVYGDVKADGTPVENATVALEVRDPSASLSVSTMACARSFGFIEPPPS